MTYFPEGMIPPPVTMDTIGFWEAAKEHRLVLQRCDDCSRFQHPPSPVCHRCRSSAVGWKDVDGRGRVYTYTAVHKAFIPTLNDHLPYLVAVIELPGADGTRIVSNLVDVDPAAVQIGMDVEVVWDDYPELSVPRFRPA